VLFSYQLSNEGGFDFDFHQTLQLAFWNNPIQARRRSQVNKHRNPRKLVSLISTSCELMKATSTAAAVVTVVVGKTEHSLHANRLL